MGAMLRPAANLLGATMALALLGILLLVSSGSDDRRQQLLDYGLREIREMGSAMQSEVVTADSLELDVSERFRALGLAFDTVVRQLDETAGSLQQDDQAPLQRPRMLAFELFNSIDESASRRTATDELARRLSHLMNEGRALHDGVSAFSRAQRHYLEQREAVQAQGRDLVRELRQRGQSAAADTAFAGVQQALDRIRRVAAADTSAVETTLQRLREITVPQDALSADLRELTAAISSLLALRLDVNEHLGQISASGFPARADELRETVGRDYLYTLHTVGDARVLLNVYTLMMLLILVYFGIRLQHSHRVLNRSHALLEERVKERTQELESAYEDLKESQVQLVQAEKMSSLGQLVAGVVHEINTPLLYVMNNTDMTHESIVEVQRDLEPVRALLHCLKQPELDKHQVKAALENLRSTMDVEALDESLSEIASLTTDSQEGLRDIDELVKSLKDFSRLDRATYDRFDVREGLEKTLLITKNLLKYGIVVEREFQDVPEILCAPSRVNQVFINLITNAAQAMEGEGALRISTYADGDGWVHVEIRDTGCGIPEENLAKVMDPFFTTKPVGQGTGLGLSIVRKIMDEHGGTLLIDSKEGVGTKITLSFPIEGASGETGPADEAEAA